MGGNEWEVMSGRVTFSSLPLLSRRVFMTKRFINCKEFTLVA